jgi:uncharacterized protein (TIGR03086 family)
MTIANTDAQADTEKAAVDLIDLHARVGRATRAIVAGIAPDMWAAPTNCSKTVRALLNHVVTGHYWAAELVQGKTIAQVGSSLDGDVLGEDPLGAYDRGLAAAQAAFGRPGGLEQLCALSYGNVPGAVYCSHRILDTFIHGWDLARAAGQDGTLDPELVEIAYAMFKPHAPEFAGTGAFAAPIDVPAEADTQTRLLAMLGRDNRR